jgi:hypothetical protein
VFLTQGVELMRFLKLGLFFIICTVLVCTQAYAADFWIDDFIGTFGNQPVDWEDETNTTGFNAEIAYSATTSQAAITRTATDIWGKVLSPQQIVDIDVYPWLEIEVSSISTGATWKLGIQEIGGTYQHWELQSSSSSTGKFQYNYADSMGRSGTQDFKVEIVVEGAGGETVVIDSVRLFDAVVSQSVSCGMSMTISE